MNNVLREATRALAVAGAEAPPTCTLQNPIGAARLMSEVMKAQASTEDGPVVFAKVLRNCEVIEQPPKLRPGFSGGEQGTLEVLRLMLQHWDQQAVSGLQLSPVLLPRRRFCRPYVKKRKG